MPTPLAVRVFGKSWQEADRLLGKPRAMGSNHTFHEYARAGGGYYVVFEKGVSVLVTVTIRMPGATPEAALASIGFALGGKKPALRTALEARWEKLEGIPVVIVRATAGKRWDSIELKRR